MRRMAILLFETTHQTLLSIIALLVAIPEHKLSGDFIHWFGLHGAQQNCPVRLSNVESMRVFPVESFYLLCQKLANTNGS